MKKISVIMPVYNKERYIERAINSILNQTLQEFELIIIDDGSKDNSGKICDKWAEKDDRIRVWHIQNGGVSNARNVALNKAMAEYITFVDADDYVGKTYLENLYDCIEKEQVDLVITGYTKIWEKTNKEEKLIMPVLGAYQMKEILPYFAEWQNKTGIFGYCVGKIFSSDIVKGIYFNTEMKLAEDFDFYLKLYDRVKSIYFDSHTDYFYIQETENCTSLVSDYNIDYIKQLELNIRYADFLKSKNVYRGMNKEIVQNKISNYFYFALFYCEIKTFDECFENLYKIYKDKKIVLKGAGIKKYFLFLLKMHNKYCAKISLLFYRYLRKIKWRIKNDKYNHSNL